MCKLHDFHPEYVSKIKKESKAMHYIFTSLFIYHISVKLSKVLSKDVNMNQTLPVINLLSNFSDDQQTLHNQELITID